MSSLRRAAWPVAITGGALGVIALRGLPQWLAMAVVLAAIPWLGAAIRGLALPEAVGAKLRRHAPTAVLVACAAWLLWPLVLGQMPASRDHAIHYFQTRILIDEMLPTGRLTGWTERFNHGFPFAEGYPVLGMLWACGLHLLSFGAIGLRHSYAWGLLAMWALTLWGSWALAQAVATEIRARRDPTASDDDVMSRWAGCAGAMLWLLDPGAARQGGWEYLMFHGVWPQQLSTALWIASCVWTMRALAVPSSRRIAIAALLFAASLLAHPFGLLSAVASTVGIGVVACVARDPRLRPAGGLRVLAVVVVLGAMLAAWNLATFFAAASELGRSPVAWLELGELAAKLVTGELFAGTWTIAGPAVLVGLGLALWSGRAHAWLVAGMVLGLLVLASRDAITTLGLDLLASGFKNLQFPRFAITVKPLAYALGGAAIVVVVELVRAGLRGDDSRTTSRRWFVALVLAPCAVTVLARSDVMVRRPVGSVDTLERSGLVADEQALRDALMAESELSGGLRVAFLRSGMGGGTYPMLTLADLGAAAVLDGHVATINFEHMIERRSPDVLARLGVTHVIHDRPLGDDDRSLAAALTEVGRFGPYVLERFGEPPDDDARFVRGSGEIVEIERSPEHRVWDITTTGGTFEIPWAPSVRWRWTLDGVELASTNTSVRGSAAMLAVEVPHGGRLALDYRTTPAERRAPWLSALALIIVLAMLWLARPLAWDAWPRDAIRRRQLHWVAAGLGALIVALAIRRSGDQLARTWTEYAGERVAARTRGDFGFVDDLTRTREISVDRDVDTICDGVLGKDALADCEDGDYRVNPSFFYIEPYLYRCVGFGIAAGDSATVSMGRPGDLVAAFLARRGNERTRDIRYSFGDAIAVLGPRRADLVFRPDQFPSGATMTIENRGTGVEQVCIGAARFE
jgi:hypothetical protein